MSDENKQDKKPDRKPEAGSGISGKSLLIIMVVVIGLIIMSSLFRSATRENEISITSFRESVQATFHESHRDKNIPTIKSIKISPDEHLITGEFNDPVQDIKKGKAFRVIIPTNFGTYDYIQKIEQRNDSSDKPIDISYKTRSQWMDTLMWLVPWVLIILFFWFFLFRQIRGAGGPGGLLSFGKSPATLVSKENPQTTFKDVAGIDEAKEEIQEIVEFLKAPKKFQRLGGRIPKGVLLVGPPGTGKTLLARAIAGEADVPFFSIAGSDFVEMFVGVGASRVRDLFSQAKEFSPSIIFLDEIDAVGRRRGTGMGGGHDEREQTLNAILVEMDGFESDHKVIIIAATNRQDVLDPALLRPGRFDRHVFIDLPDIRGREEILRVHAGRVTIGDDVVLKTIGRATPGFSGADLENLINEAALIAVMNDHDAIMMADLENARDKVLFGRAKTSRVIDPDEKKITAFHEAGHALTGYFLPLSDNPHKITIIPHGRAAGLTSFLPEKESGNMSRKRLMALLQVMYGGRIAEELFCDDISAGAANDIQRATNIARDMVISWGMSEKLGPLHYGDNSETLFLGREITRTQKHSEETSRLIDQEVAFIVKTAYDNGKKLLQEKEKEVHLLADLLMERETVTYDDLQELLDTGSVASPKEEAELDVEQADAQEEKKSASDAVIDTPNDLTGNEGLAPA